MLTADTVLNAIKETLIEQGMLPTVSLEDRDEKSLVWWNGKTYASLTLWTYEDNRSLLSSHRDGKTTYIQTFDDIESLAAGYRQALDEMTSGSPVSIAFEVINEFSQDYLKPLGISGSRLSLFRDRDEVALYWYGAGNRLCNLSIWVPELEASFTAYKDGAIRVDKDFTDMSSLRASFPFLMNLDN